MKIVSSRESNINLTPVGVVLITHRTVHAKYPRKGHKVFTIKKVAIKKNAAVKKKCYSKKRHLTTYFPVKLTSIVAISHLLPLSPLAENTLLRFIFTFSVPIPAPYI